MKLILKDYIATLKEEIELEDLLQKILFLNGFSQIIPPQKGTKQNGVDLKCKKGKDLYLFVLKQGDVNRKQWNDGINAIRPTIEEIIDKILPIENKFIKGKIYIILCTNGYIKQEVENDWNNYSKRNSNSKTILNFWGIDILTNMTNEYLINEYLLDDDLKSYLRKTLYFCNLVDNDLYYFKYLLDKIIEKLSITSRDNKNYEKIKLIFLLITKISIKYSDDEKNNKLSIKMCEIAMLKYWVYILENNLFEKSKESEILIELGKSYSNSCRNYIKSIKEVCKFKPSFIIYNPLEYRLLIYEAIGIITTYTNYLLYYFGNNEEVKETTDILITLMNNNNCYMYPVYDLHSIEINSLLMLLYNVNKNNCKIVLEAIISSIISKMRLSKYYPIEYENYDKAVLMEFNDSLEEEFSASNLIYNLLEWLIIFDMTDIIKPIMNYLLKKYPNLSYNAWQLKIDDEIEYFKGTNYDIGTPFIDSEKISIKAIKRMMKLMHKHSNINNFNTIKYSCSPYFLISARLNRNPIPSMFWQEIYATRDFKRNKI